MFNRVCIDLKFDTFCIMICEHCRVKILLKHQTNFIPLIVSDDFTSLYTTLPYKPIKDKRYTAGMLLHINGKFTMPMGKVK